MTSAKMNALTITDSHKAHREPMSRKENQSICCSSTIVRASGEDEAAKPKFEMIYENEAAASASTAKSRTLTDGPVPQKAYDSQERQIARKTGTLTSKYIHSYFSATT